MKKNILPLSPLPPSHNIFLSHYVAIKENILIPISAMSNFTFNVMLLDIARPPKYHYLINLQKKSYFIIVSQAFISFCGIRAVIYIISDQKYDAHGKLAR